MKHEDSFIASALYGENWYALKLAMDYFTKRIRPDSRSSLLVFVNRRTILFCLSFAFILRLVNFANKQIISFTYYLFYVFGFGNWY